MTEQRQSDKPDVASEPRPGDEIRPSRYRKLPVTIEAIRWTGDNLRAVIDFTGLHPSANKWTWEEYEAAVAKDGFKIFTLEGAHMVTVGDYVIRGVKGEFYACKPDIFWLTYERATEAEVDATLAKDAERYRRFKANSHIKQMAGFGPFWSTYVTLDGALPFDEAMDKAFHTDGPESPQRG